MFNNEFNTIGQKKDLLIARYVGFYKRRVIHYNDKNDKSNELSIVFIYIAECMLLKYNV